MYFGPIIYPILTLFAVQGILFAQCFLPPSNPSLLP
jgi:hypothetical protein